MEKSFTQFTEPYTMDRTQETEHDKPESGYSKDNPGQYKPRATTISFLRQFARAYRAFPGRSIFDAPGLVLN